MLERNLDRGWVVIVSEMKRIVSVAVVVVVLFGACTDDGPEPKPDPEPAPTETSTEAPDESPTTAAKTGRTIPLQVWFLTELRGEPVLRLHHVYVPATQAVGRAAIEALLAGVPEDLERLDPKASSAVPEETELLGLTIDSGVATVDFNEEFGNTGLGSSYDGIQIDQVTWTLTQFPTVKRVRYLIDGEVPKEGIGGHGIIVDKPETRKNSENYLPPIVVESPYLGQKVDGGFTISGLANVFEANVNYRIRGLLPVQFTTATCGTGCYGTFEAELGLSVKAPTDAVLEVYESSAEDGRPLHKVSIPITLVP